MSDYVVDEAARAAMQARFEAATDEHLRLGPGAAQAAARLEGARFLVGEKGYDDELALMVAEAEHNQAAQNYRLSGVQLFEEIGQGAEARELREREAANMQAAAMTAQYEARASLLAAFAKAPAVDDVKVFTDAVAFDRLLRLATTPKGFDPQTFKQTATEDQKSLHEARLRAARDILVHREAAAYAIGARTYLGNATVNAARAMRDGMAAAKAADTKAATRKRVTALLAAIPLGLVFALMVIAFLATTLRGHVQHWQLFPVILLSGCGFAWCMRSIAPRLVIPSLAVMGGLVVFNLLPAAAGIGSHKVATNLGMRDTGGGSSLMEFVFLAGAAVAAWCLVPFGSTSPEERRKALLALGPHAALSLLGAALVLPCLMFLGASWDMQIPGLLAWLLLVGIAAALAVIGHKDKLAVGAAIGVPIIVAVVAMARAAGGPMLVYPFGVIALVGLLAATDHWFGVALRLVGLNLGKHQQEPYVFDKTITLTPLLRGRLAAELRGLLLLFVVSVLVAAYDFPRQVNHRAGFASLGLVVVVGVVLYFIFLRLSPCISVVVRRNPSLEGPLRKEEIFQGGQSRWVTRGHAGGPGTVLADDMGVDANEPARPGYDRVWDDATGKYVWRQSIVGNPNIKTNVEPLRPDGQFGKGGMVSEPD